jgi:hypothetical protein
VTSETIITVSGSGIIFQANLFRLFAVLNGYVFNFPGRML